MLPWLAGFPLHPDEALYGAWGRAIAGGTDPLLLSAWVDKPPLVIYLIGGSLGLFGVSPFALRLPGMIAGVLLPAATYACAAPLAGKRPALVAAALAAFSPFAVLFAPAALTDGWLTLWLLLAGAAALRGRATLAGLLAGLALASKQQGVLAPALALPWLLLAHPSAGTHRWRVRQPLRFLLPLAAVAGLVTWWDSARWAVRPSFWDRSIVTYGGIWLLPPAAWPERLARWAEPFGYTFGHPLLSLAVLLLAGVAGWRAWRRPVPHGNPAHVRALTLFVLAYAAGHLVFSVQTWDRYLLPLVPLLAILAAPEIVRVSARVPVSAKPVAALAGGALLVWWAFQAATGSIPVGTNYSAARGAAEVAGASACRAPGHAALPPLARLAHGLLPLWRAANGSLVRRSRSDGRSGCRYRRMGA